MVKAKARLSHYKKCAASGDARTKGGGGGFTSIKRKEEKAGEKREKYHVKLSQRVVIAPRHTHTHIQVQHPVVSQCVSLGLSGPL